MGLLVLLLFWVFPLYADWNEDFDAQSHQLVECVPDLQNPHYFHEYDSFIEIRKILLHNKSLKKTIKEERNDHKLVIYQNKDNLIIKKRRNNCINELFVWELSYLLNASEFVVPSFPVQMEGKTVIVQKRELIVTGKEESNCPPEKIVEAVSLRTYWKAHFLAYLLGFRDLAGRNIGINPEGLIRFFDNEASLRYNNGLEITIPFVSQSFDWPQYRIPLDIQTVDYLKHFVKSLSHFESKLQQYLSIRQIPFSQEDFAVRLEKVRRFPLKKGACFRDFYGQIFPELDPGLDDLNRIVERIVGRKVDHGSALFFLLRKKKHPLSDQEALALDLWAQTYKR